MPRAPKAKPSSSLLGDVLVVVVVTLGLVAAVASVWVPIASPRPPPPLPTLDACASAAWEFFF